MTANEILDMMRKNMGSVPAAIEKSVPVDPALIQEHMRSKAFAMPQENPALDEATRTLIYLAAALAGTNRACVQAHVQPPGADGRASGQDHRDGAHHAPGDGHQDHRRRRAGVRRAGGEHEVSAAPGRLE